MVNNKLFKFITHILKRIKASASPKDQIQEFTPWIVSDCFLSNGWKEKLSLLLCSDKQNSCSLQLYCLQKGRELDGNLWQENQTFQVYTVFLLVFLGYILLITFLSFPHTITLCWIFKFSYSQLFNLILFDKLICIERQLVASFPIIPKYYLPGISLCHCYMYGHILCNGIFNFGRLVWGYMKILATKWGVSSHRFAMKFDEC